MANVVELWVDQVRNACSVSPQLDEGHAVDGSDELAAAALIHAEQGWQSRKGRVVDVQGVREKLADLGMLAGCGYRLQIASGIQQPIGPRATLACRYRRRLGCRCGGQWAVRCIEVASETQPRPSRPTCPRFAAGGLHPMPRSR